MWVWHKSTFAQLVFQDLMAQAETVWGTTKKRTAWGSWQEERTAQEVQTGQVVKTAVHAFLRTGRVALALWREKARGYGHDQWTCLQAENMLVGQGLRRWQAQLRARRHGLAMLQAAWGSSDLRCRAACWRTWRRLVQENQLSFGVEKLVRRWNRLWKPRHKRAAWAALQQALQPTRMEMVALGGYAMHRVQHAVHRWRKWRRHTKVG